MKARYKLEDIGSPCIRSLPVPNRGLMSRQGLLSSPLVRHPSSSSKLHFLFTVAILSWENTSYCKLHGIIISLSLWLEGLSQEEVLSRVLHISATVPFHSGFEAPCAPLRFCCKKLPACDLRRRTSWRIPPVSSVIHVTCLKIRIGQSTTWKVESAASLFIFTPRPARSSFKCICIDLRTEDLCRSGSFSARASRRFADRSWSQRWPGPPSQHWPGPLQTTKPRFPIFSATAITNRQ